jgi:hypothetical protein
MCNKSGAWDSPVSDTTLSIPKDFRFSGRLLVLDADGSVRGELRDEEAVRACGEVLRTGPQEIAGYAALADRASTKLTFLEQKRWFK